MEDSKLQPEGMHVDASSDKEGQGQANAILIGAYKQGVNKALAHEHVEELSLLARTYRFAVAEKWCTMVREFSAATFLSEGKISQLKDRITATQANVVIFDDEISPAQQRNLEAILKVPVMDRTEVILGVFADRAKTREAKLQIEMAQLEYIAPRLKRMWLHLSRQTGGGGGGGGGGYLRGKGEKQIEMDRRALRRRQEQLREELRGVVQYRHTQRARRERNAVPVFAIIGYTNAGKSTLMKRLTGAQVVVEDMLFATLDTTTRQFVLPDHQPILLTDTVGFIRKLPHLLVAAFKSTLEEAFEADVLLHIIDSSHPQALEQAKTTFEVLEELNAQDRPIITVVNKIDASGQLGEAEHQAMIQKLRLSYPRAILISASTGEGLENLFAEMMEVLKSRRKRVMLRVHQKEYQFVAEAVREGKIFSTEYDGDEVLMEVELPAIRAGQLARYVQAESFIAGSDEHRA